MGWLFVLVVLVTFIGGARLIHEDAADATEVDPDVRRFHEETYLDA